MMGRGSAHGLTIGAEVGPRGFRGDKCLSHGRKNPAERDLSRLIACVFWRVIDRLKEALGVMRQREVAHPISEWPVHRLDWRDASLAKLRRAEDQAKPVR